MLHQGKLRFAGIGPRDTPQDVLERMAHMGHMFAEAGWIGVSGYADGADQAWLSKVPFEQQEVWLPWNSYNGATEYKDPHGRFHRVRIGHDIHAVAKNCYAGDWNGLSNGAHLLFARNVAIIARDTLDTPVDLVVYWQSEQGERKPYGGTNHAVRVAKAIDVPCFNIRLMQEVQAMSEFVNELMEKAA